MKWIGVFLGGFLGVLDSTWGEAFLPVLAVEQLVISDGQAYGELVEEINGAMREKYAVPLFLRAYEATSTSERGERAFSLSPAGSFAGLMENQARFEGDGELAGFRERLAELSDASGRVFLKAARFDGTNSPGWLLNTLVATEDEGELLERLASVVTELGFAEGTGPKVNVFRVVAGEVGFTHLVSFNFESRATLGAGLDAIAERGWSLAYSENGEVACLVVESGVWRELVP